MKITAFADKDFYLLEVIALILEHLRKKLEEYLSKREDARRYLKAKDFSWVVTVPAIWKHRGKQLMREAAYRVRLWLHYLIPACIIPKNYCITVYNFVGSNMTFYINLFISLTPCLGASCDHAYVIPFIIAIVIRIILYLI